MVKKRFQVLIIMGLMVIAFSCSKETKPQVGVCDAFSYDGNFYETFQEAVDALSSSASGESMTITLNKDVSDGGATLSEKVMLNIRLDLGDHVYTIDQGGSINVGGNVFEITGDGGAIVSSGEGFCIECGKGGLLRLLGNVKLLSANVLDSSSPVCVEEDFCGSIEGNVSLHETQFNLAPSSGKVIIPTLSVYGNEAVFSIDAQEDETSGQISIGKVLSDREYPVVAIRKDAVSVSEGQVHVHSFSRRKVDGTCCIPDSYVLVCKDCGYEIADPEEHEVTFGKCDSDDLVKHEKVEPSECLFGNVEYYECPDCGRIYRDDSCNELLPDGEIVLLPTNIDNIMEASLQGSRMLVNDVVDFIYGFISLVPGIVTTEYQTWTTPVKEFREFSRRLGALSTKLDDISNQITVIATEVNTIPYKMKVQDRMAQLAQIKLLNQNTNEALSIIFNDSRYTQAQMDSLKALHIQQWSGVYPGSTSTLHPHELVLTLMNDFSTVVIGPNVPQMYGEVISSYFLWEHFGYPLRTLMLMYDAAVVATAYYYAQNYARVVKPYSSDLMRVAYKTTLEQSYNNYMDELLAELGRMVEREVKYRRYMPTNTTYERELYCSFNFVPFFNNTSKPLYLPRKNASVSVRNCNEMMEYKEGKLVGRSFMDFRVAMDTYQGYQSLKKAGKLPKGYPDKLNVYQLLDSLGFIGKFKNSNFRILMNATQTFGYDNGEISHPMYWNVKWRSYAGSKYNDWIGVSPVLRDDATTGDDKLVKDCNISVSDGFVSDRNDLTDIAKNTIYGAIMVAQQDQKPQEGK